jgi:hypothetical protein
LDRSKQFIAKAAGRLQQDCFRDIRKILQDPKYFLEPGKSPSASLNGRLAVNVALVSGAPVKHGISDDIDLVVFQVKQRD